MQSSACIDTCVCGKDHHTLTTTRHAVQCEFMTFNFAMQAIDQVVNSAAKTLYMSGGIQPCNITFRGPNGFASGVAAHTPRTTAPGTALSPVSRSSLPGLPKMPRVC